LRCSTLSFLNRWLKRTTWVPKFAHTFHTPSVTPARSMSIPHADALLIEQIPDVHKAARIVIQYAISDGDAKVTPALGG
jgi:hypothetical protein